MEIWLLRNIQIDSAMLQLRVGCRVGGWNCQKGPFCRVPRDVGELALEATPNSLRPNRFEQKLLDPDSILKNQIALPDALGKVDARDFS